ncbi:uncharacterized protein MELLADRAFT_104897 [Melampsora larici-populina 98AG31]|uniref:Uncharacterized protein n=1 Tax=Melampsora larici-populina (strain 98AG31 / pathotype 3-4-7) TaxID=747676 RepID=F4RGF9_MELLP|nr:uncharacterized protein MELLADRAFT_104897 [Melampsora larici-populina 98AG31]EGG08657.1 hypothetical protein MELLADRAFT_104897 [Melampsora larici-populina 98AG31]
MFRRYPVIVVDHCDREWQLINRGRPSRRIDFDTFILYSVSLFSMFFIQAEIPDSGPEVEEVNKKRKYKLRMFIYSIFHRYDDLIDRFCGHEYETAREALTTVYNRAGIRPSEESIVIVDRFSKIISDNETISRVYSHCACAPKKSGAFYDGDDTIESFVDQDHVFRWACSGLALGAMCLESHEKVCCGVW